MANDNNIQPMADDLQIVLYQPDDSIRLEVKLEQDTVWLTQAQMTELFRTTRNNITMHIRNIFKEREFEEKSACKDYLHTTAELVRKQNHFVCCKNVKIRFSQD